MDGVHDLGGREGFGAIDTEAPPFRHEWEARMWAIAKNTGSPQWTLDWWRHMGERIPPEAYIGMPYFEKWCLIQMTGFVTAGDFSLEEAVRGHTEVRNTPPAARDVEGALQRLKDNEIDFEMPPEQPAVFSPGDEIMTHRTMAAHHTRLPGYARGRHGVVTAHHGAHVFADDNAQGVRRAVHLYTVEFTAQELWGPEAHATDTVLIDLWEPYLVRA